MANTIADTSGYDPALYTPPSQVGTGNAGGLMAAGMFTSMFSSIAGAFAQSNAIDMQNKFNQQQSEFNANIADLQAKSALDDGERQAQTIERSGQAAVASERVSAGAAGVEVNSGSAMDVQTTSKAMSALDALTTRNNAARAAWGYKVQAQNTTNQAAIDNIAAGANRSTTLLTGGLNAVSYGTQGAYYANGGTILSPKTSASGKV